MPDDEDPRKERRLATERRRREPGKPGLSDRKMSPERREQLFKWFAACEAADAAGEEPPPMPVETQPDGFQEQVNGRWVEWKNGKRLPLVPWNPSAEREHDLEREKTTKILDEDLKRFNEGIPFEPPAPDAPEEGECRNLNGREIEFREGRWLDLLTGEPADLSTADAFAQETDRILLEMRARLANAPKKTPTVVEEEPEDEEDPDEDD